jgi:hypothetical protein
VQGDAPSNRRGTRHDDAGSWAESRSGGTTSRVTLGCLNAMDSIAERLSKQLETIVNTMDELLDASTITDDRARNQQMRREAVFAFFPDYSWGDLDDDQRRLQRELLELWTPWSEQVRLLFSGDTTGTQDAIAEAETRVATWIQRDDGRDHTIPPSIPEAKHKFRELVQPFLQLLRSMSDTAGEVIAVPDTNVVLRQPDVIKYAGVLGTDHLHRPSDPWRARRDRPSQDEPQKRDRA